MERFRRFVKLVAIGLVVAALIEQLRRDPDDRTWEGANGSSCRRCSGSAGP